MTTTTLIKRSPAGRAGVAALAAAAFLLTACGSQDETAPTADSQEDAHDEDHEDHDHEDDDNDDEEGPDRVEVDHAHPRLVVATDDGVTVLDASDGTQLGTFATESRPAPAVAGDGRYVFLAQSDANLTQVLDGGSWAVAHGDHAHYYIVDPSLSGVTIEGGYPVHVVSHDEQTAIFHDDEGTATVFRDAGLRIDSLDTTIIDSGAPHHGVVVPLSTGAVVSIPPPPGDDTLPTGVYVVDEAGSEIARFDDCPGLHGEAAVGDVLAFACADGVLLVEGTAADKVDYPSEDGRIGSFSAGPVDHYLVGNFTSTSLLAVDVEHGSAREITLDLPYAARAMDEHGDVVVLTTDGTLHVIDPSDGDIESTMPGVVAEFEIPEDWREPRPTMTVAGHTAYVADPATSTVVVVDLEDLVVEDTYSVDAVPTAIVVAGAGDSPDH